MCGPTVTPWGYPAEGMDDCFHLHCQAGGWDWLHHLHGWQSHLAWQWSPTLTGLWWLSCQCALWVWGCAVCCFLEWEAWTLTLFYLLALSTVLSQVFWQECLIVIETPKLVWVPFLLLGLPELFSWHTYGIESSACPIQGSTYPSQHPFMSFTAWWSRFGGFSTTLKYALTCSTFCLIFIDGRSSMNLMVSMGVSLVVPSMTCIALFCTLSSFSRFACAIVVGPSP